jgi:hypothetical protein
VRQHARKGGEDGTDALHQVTRTSVLAGILDAAIVRLKGAQFAGGGLEFEPLGGVFEDLGFSNNSVVCA